MEVEEEEEGGVEVDVEGVEELDALRAAAAAAEKESKRRKRAGVSGREETRNDENRGRWECSKERREVTTTERRRMVVAVHAAAERREVPTERHRRCSCSTIVDFSPNPSRSLRCAFH